ncbi:MAG: DUF3153 domain-containing protein [Prochlorococcaceae cyanobacterium]|jgi:hypothetical protein
MEQRRESADGPDPLAAARWGLERGEYGQVLRLLEPLAAEHPPTGAFGGELRLLMATALMGQGRTDQAAECCRSLHRCRDSVLRAQAKNLLEVLEAPSLQRPREWSMTLPSLGEAPALEGSRAGGIRRRRRDEPPPPPPVGATRAPLGFAAVVIALVLLALSLGGCMQVHSEIHFEGPGRVRLEHRLRSASGRITPWQQQLGRVLEAEGFRRSLENGTEILRGPTQPAAAALGALTEQLEQAARLGGLHLPPPQLELQERNWGVGVQQRLHLTLDLLELEAVPGLDLGLELAPLHPRAVLEALPRPTAPGRVADSRFWPLEAGALNRLELRCWRWSPLGMGGLAVALLLLLVSLLQTLRRRAGFGWPELPA